MFIINSPYYLPGLPPPHAGAPIDIVAAHLVMDHHRVLRDLLARVDQLEAREAARSQEERALMSTALYQPTVPPSVLCLCQWLQWHHDQPEEVCQRGIHPLAVPCTCTVCMGQAINLKVDHPSWRKPATGYILEPLLVCCRVPPARVACKRQYLLLKHSGFSLPRNQITTSKIHGCGLATLPCLALPAARCAGI